MASEPTLDRELTLPMLIFTGVGVTVGAGIFALVGEILGIAGDQAPLAFIVAGLVAGCTALSYMLLIRAFPKAGGEAVYVTRGLGGAAGLPVGLGVAATGIISSAVVAKAFAGYLTTIIELPERVVAMLVVVALGAVAWWGIKESVLLTATITILEVGTLVVVIVLGADLVTADVVADTIQIPDTAAASGVLTAAAVAFFAFIGFEDIANMAEEAVEPRRTGPRAVAWTLVISMTVYVALALVAAGVEDRASITESSAPLADLFETVAGREPTAVAAIASLAMINGVLVQIVMAARMLYGMAGERLLPTWLGAIDPRRHTPWRATGVVVCLILILVAGFPILTLAKTTSFVVLAVFTLVNVALWRLARGHRPGTASPAGDEGGEDFGRGALIGGIGALGSLLLWGWQLADLLGWG